MQSLNFLLILLWGQEYRLGFNMIPGCSETLILLPQLLDCRHTPPCLAYYSGRETGIRKQPPARGLALSALSLSGDSLSGLRWPPQGALLRGRLGTHWGHLKSHLKSELKEHLLSSQSSVLTDTGSLPMLSYNLPRSCSHLINCSWIPDS